MSSWHPGLQEQGSSAVMVLTWMLAVLQARRACVFPCVWPLFPLFMLDFMAGFRGLYSFISIANASSILCVHRSWWEFLDENLPPMQRSCFITLKYKRCDVDWKQLLTWRAEVHSMAWCSISLHTGTPCIFRSVAPTGSYQILDSILLDVHQGSLAPSQSFTSWGI